MDKDVLVNKILRVIFIIVTGIILTKFFWREGRTGFLWILSGLIFGIAVTTNAIVKIETTNYYNDFWINQIRILKEFYQYKIDSLNEELDKIRSKDTE